MSFFGFDPSGQPGHRKDGKLDLDSFQNFDDEMHSEEEDALNDETFGAAADNLSKDFDFSSGSGSKLSSKGGLKPAPAPIQPNAISYAQAANTTGNDSLRPMESLWNDQQQNSEVQSAQSQETEPEKKVFSLEEIEAKMRAQPPPSQLPQLPPPQQQFSPGMNPFMLPPQAQQQLLASAIASGRYPDMQTAARAVTQMLMAPPPMSQQGMMPQGMMPPPFMGYPVQPMGMGLPQQGLPQQGLPQQGLPQQGQIPQPIQQAPIQPENGETQRAQQHQSPLQTQEEQAAPAPEAPSVAQVQVSPPEERLDLNSFPTIEAASQTKSADSSSASSPRQPQQSHQLQQHQQGFHQQGYRGGNNYRGHHFYNQQQRQYQQRQQVENLNPEERSKYLARQEKVGKITRASGFMNPRDKDFITRIQLSQIVTDDPYNEDFYCQVYKVLNSSVEENSMNYLAKKYLEQSGHRLGGRSKRADIALQRMQQQVSKAVSVAKERGERSGVLSKEGALGKVSFGTGKRPRQLLVVNAENKENDENDLLPKEYKMYRSSRSVQLSSIESVYSEVLKLESRERENEGIDDSELWKSLQVSDGATAEDTVDPFVALLSFDKMMKVFTRVFPLLSAEHKIATIERIFSDLQKVDVVLKGSYKNYPQQNYEIPKDVRSRIELFQITVLKTLVLYLSDAPFALVLHLLDSIVKKNNVLFLCTTKIGLSLITVLISRLELIKQEFSKNLSAQDLSQWQQTYDSLFQCLEGRLVTVIPPYFSKDEQKSVKNGDSEGDDSYIWQFLASLSLAGLLDHQRIIVDEVRDEIFGAMAAAKKLKTEGNVERAEKYLNNLNLFLNVMGLKANEDDITELSDE
ncbi:DEKNAAC104858 [Brettanomyces naardenensis]|uniref:DEKNAAC104858 n=1 Tax=Brettanomyces naardenensis TaxID=13370 RepID=A0A448YS48_BRENA|nr:DEKNAAC104858 [Brettanomyces naardenensis]